MRTELRERPAGRRQPRLLQQRQLRNVDQAAAVDRRGQSVGIAVAELRSGWRYRNGPPAFSRTVLDQAPGKRNMLKLAGIGPIRETLVGGVESIGDTKRQS